LCLKKKSGTINFGSQANAKIMPFVHFDHVNSQETSNENDNTNNEPLIQITSSDKHYKF
jgi:hypothetical protein